MYTRRRKRSKPAATRKRGGVGRSRTMPSFRTRVKSAWQRTKQRLIPCCRQLKTAEAECDRKMQDFGRKKDTFIDDLKTDNKEIQRQLLSAMDERERYAEQVKELQKMAKSQRNQPGKQLQQMAKCDCESQQNIQKQFDFLPPVNNTNVVRQLKDALQENENLKLVNNKLLGTQHRIVHELMRLDPVNAAATTSSALKSNKSRRH